MTGRFGEATAGCRCALSLAAISISAWASLLRLVSPTFMQRSLNLEFQILGKAFNAMDLMGE